MLSIAAPFGGSYWYGLTALSPLAGLYYFQKGTREEECAVRSARCPAHTQQHIAPPVRPMAQISHYRAGPYSDCTWDLAWGLA